MEGIKVFHAGTGRGADGIVTAGGRVLGVTARAPGIANAIAKVMKQSTRFTGRTHTTEKTSGRRPCQALWLGLISAEQYGVKNTHAAGSGVNPGRAWRKRARLLS